MKLDNNQTLHQQRYRKNDEFYTQYKDVEKELQHYKEFLKDKVILCPCDSKKSNFYKYLKNNFKEFQLKKIICSCIKVLEQEPELVIFDGENETTTSLITGDFFTEEIQPYINECDVIITNIPFSSKVKFQDFLINCGKKFIILTSFLLNEKYTQDIKDNKLRIGYNTHVSLKFDTPVGLTNYTIGVAWFTNFQVPWTPKLRFKLTKKFNEITPEYLDNTDILHCNESINVPVDYDKPIAVPITFLYRADFDNEWELVDIIPRKNLKINGKDLFRRLLIQRRKRKE